MSNLLKRGPVNQGFKMDATLLIVPRVLPPFCWRNEDRTTEFVEDPRRIPHLSHSYYP